MFRLCSNMIGKRAFSAAGRPRFLHQARMLNQNDADYDKRERFYLQQGDKDVSPWHDLPLHPWSWTGEKGELDVFTGVIEITRNTTAKMEVETTRKSNPVVQDQKKDKKTGEKYLRHYGIEPVFNYGMVPQTWENVHHEDKATGCFGDNDPLDIVDLTPRDMALLELPDLKVIGSLCFIDEGEIDWKLIAVEASYAKEHGIRDEVSFGQKHPGGINAVREWFRTYKTYDGKPEGKFGFDEKVLGVEQTIEIIYENHKFYKQLLAGEIANPDNELVLE